MTAVHLIEKRIALTISEPWDFGTECGVGPFYGYIIDVEEKRFLIALENPITYSNATYVLANCQLRYEDDSTSDLRGRAAITVNVTLRSGQAQKLTEINGNYSGDRMTGIGTIHLC